MRLAFWLSLLVLLMPGVAQAEWLEASSAHFVVYADDSEADVRAISQQLERYHVALATVTGRHMAIPSPSNRLTVYIVGSKSEVRRLYGGGGRYVGAFHISSTGNSLAVSPPVTPAGAQLKFSMLALLHEYTHHFMAATSDAPMPPWYEEGGADFYASAHFSPEGGVELGLPVRVRLGELRSKRDVSVADLIDPTEYNRRKGGGYDAFYAKSWLLFYYLTFDAGRRGQLQRYAQLIAQGKGLREAGLQAFGNLDRLDQEVDAYRDTAQRMQRGLPAVMADSGAIAIRRLSEGEAAMMPVRTRSKCGVTEEQATKLLPEARGIAARFPADPAVLTALAEAEYDAGNDRQAIAAADAALTRDPSQANAYVQKGLALFRLAARASDPSTAYARAREPFAALHRLEPDHPLPLVYYYRSYADQGVEPPQEALDELRRAVQVAPFDTELRMTLAIEQVRHHQFEEARRNLQPVAYDPDGGALAVAAQRVLARMDGDPNWDGRDVTTLLAPNDKSGAER